jgi:hypothetical protein
MPQSRKAICGIPAGNESKRAWPSVSLLLWPLIAP